MTPAERTKIVADLRDAMTPTSSALLVAVLDDLLIEYGVALRSAVTMDDVRTKQGAAQQVSALRALLTNKNLTSAQI